MTLLPAQSGTPPARKQTFINDRAWQDGLPLGEYQLPGLSGPGSRAWVLGPAYSGLSLPSQGASVEKPRPIPT